MRTAWIPVWKKSPFIRLIIPLIAGILIQWYFSFHLTAIIVAGISFSLAFIAFRLLPLSLRFTLHGLNGLFINLLLIVPGLFITYQKDISHQQNWFGNFYHDSDYLVVTINEPLIEKNKSFKADGIVEKIIHTGKVENTSGKIILYFKKDSTINTLHYGDQILISKPLQTIKNSGNPGAFNYKRYAAFRQIHHNVFLKNKEWIMLPEKNINSFRQYIFKARQNILNILQQNMNANDNQLAIAEALLIGYTEDLDKDLVQAYSNTGVVHIIAISGMHLAFIYLLLSWVFGKIPVLKRSKIVKGILILSCLWLFAMLTGGSASILRAAVMFSFITVGKYFFKSSSIFNALALSAFLLLCYNPYYLWDVGFQLSYLAVLSIVLFQKPVYHLLFIKNKWIDKIWELAAVSIAAQILTFPICIYYFHQFPILFLFTNIIMVPLSTGILFVEIFLVAFSWLPLAGLYIGKLTWALIWVMNKIILWFNSLPFALWDGISTSLTSTLILYIFIALVGYWLLQKNKTAFKLSLITLLSYIILINYSGWQKARQQKMIVYNVPQHKAIDIINGNDYKFIGDSILLQDGMLQNFHLKPGRIALQLTNRIADISFYFSNQNFYQINDKKILLVDKPQIFISRGEKIDLDCIVISKNPHLYIKQLMDAFNCKLIVFDASNSLWKIDKWKKDCEDLHLRYYSIPEQGAFIMDL